MLVLKLSVIESWSWWRVMLPIGLFVGFNITHIVVAFIYLSFAHILERPAGDDDEVLEPHTINAHFVAAMFFFAVFGDNVVRWIEGSAKSRWFWLFSCKAEVLAVFGSLSVLALFLHWIRLGRALKASG